jgi:hypothetical protein
MHIAKGKQWWNMHCDYGILCKINKLVYIIWTSFICSWFLRFDLGTSHVLVYVGRYLSEWWFVSNRPNTAFSTANAWLWMRTPKWDWAGKQSLYISGWLFSYSLVEWEEPRRMSAIAQSEIRTGCLPMGLYRHCSVSVNLFGCKGVMFLRDRKHTASPL